jgi:hypothetical protein
MGYFPDLFNIVVVNRSDFTFVRGPQNYHQRPGKEKYSSAWAKSQPSRVGLFVHQAGDTFSSQANSE